MGWSIVLVRNCASDKDSGDSGACFGVDGLPSLGARGCGPAILFIVYCKSVYAVEFG